MIIYQNEKISNFLEKKSRQGVPNVIIYRGMSREATSYVYEKECVDKNTIN